MAACSGVVLLMVAGHEASADSFDVRDTDKQAHIAVSYGLTLTGAVVLRRFKVRRVTAVVVSAVASLALGTFKELVIDDRFSRGDKIANFVGAGLASGVVFSFEL